MPYQSFFARDGDLIIATGNDGQFQRLCAVLGLDIAHDPRFLTNAARVDHRPELLEMLQNKIAGWTKADLSEALEREGVPAGPINTLDETLANEQVVARNLRITRDGIPGIASPIVINGERMVSDRRSPHLGEQNPVADSSGG